MATCLQRDELSNGRSLSTEEIVDNINRFMRQTWKRRSQDRFIKFPIEWLMLCVSQHTARPTGETIRQVIEGYTQAGWKIEYKKEEDIIYFYP